MFSHKTIMIHLNMRMISYGDNSENFKQFNAAICAKLVDMYIRPDNESVKTIIINMSNYEHESPR